MTSNELCNELCKKHCRPTETGLSSEQITAYLKAVDNWEWLLQELNGRITKTFNFENYYQTLVFVNAIAAIFHKEDHHPELQITYNRCVIKLDTHSVKGSSGTKGGLSENDFICAAKIDAVYRLTFS